MSTVTPTKPERYRFREDQMYHMYKLRQSPAPYRGDLFSDPMSVAEYERLIDAGVLTEHDRCELIDGKVVEKMPTGNAHVAAVIWLTNLLMEKCLGRAFVSVQNPVRMANNEPEPDIVLLPKTGGDRVSGKPGISDVLLLIEVADSSLAYDLDTKARAYAEEGIREYWVYDTIGNQLFIHRDPKPDGTWNEVRKAANDEVLPIPGVDGAVVKVEDILPPA